MLPSWRTGPINAVLKSDNEAVNDCREAHDPPLDAPAVEHGRALGALKEETIMAGYPGSETERRAPAAALSLLVTEIFER